MRSRRSPGRRAWPFAPEMPARSLLQRVVRGETAGFQRRSTPKRMPVEIVATNVKSSTAQSMPIAVTL